MGKREQTKKAIKRLELRREVIRVLSSETLAQVRGGRGSVCEISCDDTGGSGCMPSIRPTGD